MKCNFFYPDGKYEPENIVHLRPKRKPKTPPKTFRRVLGIVGGKDLVCRQLLWT